jgi:dipeptidyl aminopeptidase/acylaminoacyl peptidase
VAESFLAAQDLYRIVSLSDPRLSPDGQWLAYVRTVMDRERNDYRSTIWLAPTAGGRPRPFTSGGKRDTTPRWSPDGRWLAFVSDRGGEKAKPQLYLIPTDGGEARRLTKMENGAGDPAWSPDGTRIAFTSRVNAEERTAEDEPEPALSLDPDEVERLEREKEKKEKEKSDPRVIGRHAYRAGTSYFDDRTKHLYIVDIDVETGEAKDKPHRLTQDERNYGEPRWMPDGSALLATVDRKPGTDDLFYYSDVVRVSVDAEGKAQQPHILTGPDTADHNPWPSPDGRWIAYNSLPVAEYATANAEIRLIPAAGGEPRLLAVDLDAHPRDFRWLPDGQRLCFLVSEHGRIDLRRVSVAGGTVDTLLSADREMLAYDLSPDGRRVGFVASTDRTPWELHFADLDSGDERRLTEVNAGWLAAKTLGPVEDLWFESGDGTPIQGWIVKPPDFDPQQKYPLVLSIHGGPHVMWSRHEPTMWHEWQFLAARGYVVLACNPRGSDGYGRDFRAELLRRWGEADLPDLLAGVEAVVAQGYVDPQRLAVTGDIPLLTEWEFASAPWEDPQLLWKYSPVAHVEQIHTPLLLIHSENDFRAPIPTAEGLFVALRRLGRKVTLVRYPRDGHELSRSGEPKHRVDRLERIVDWFDQHLGKPEGQEGG